MTFHGRACNSHSLSTTFRVGIDRIGAGTSTENNNNINSINYRQLHSYSRSCEGFPSHLHIKVNRSDSSSRLHRIKYPTPPVSQVRPRTHAAPINPPFLEHRLKNIPLLEYLIPQSPPARNKTFPSLSHSSWLAARSCHDVFPASLGNGAAAKARDLHALQRSSTESTPRRAGCPAAG